MKTTRLGSSSPPTRSDTFDGFTNVSDSRTVGRVQYGTSTTLLLHSIVYTYGLYTYGVALHFSSNTVSCILYKYWVYLHICASVYITTFTPLSQTTKCVFVLCPGDFSTYSYSVVPFLPYVYKTYEEIMIFQYLQLNYIKI